MMKTLNGPVRVKTTTATGQPTETTGRVSSLILPSSLVPYIWPSSPASFCTGVLVGLFVAFLRPLIEFYVDIGASYISFVMRYFLIWGSIAFLAWAILRTLQQTSAVTLVINPETEEQQQQAMATPDVAEEYVVEDQHQFISQTPMPLPPNPPNRQLLQYQSQNSHYDELGGDHPPILHLYDDEPENVEYRYERSRPASSYSGTSSNNNNHGQQSHHFQGRIMAGQFVTSSSAASIYSDLTSSSSNSSNNGNFYSPPIPQYNPYRKSPSPNLSSNRRSPSNENSGINSVGGPRVAPSQASGRTSPARKTVQSTMPVQPSTATVNSSTSNPSGAAVAYRNPSPSRSPVRSNPRGTSPTRKPMPSTTRLPEKFTGASNGYGIGIGEPRIVSLDEDDGLSTGASYRVGGGARDFGTGNGNVVGGGAAYPATYSSKIQQAHAIYGDANVLPKPEGLSILEKPAGQSAFRLKRKP